MIRVTVWGENVHEQTNKTVAGIYPDGMHGAIATSLNADPGIIATTATLQEPEHGLTEDRLSQTDVLTWWGHAAHGDVEDEIVERVARHVWAGMGIICLHSALPDHFELENEEMYGEPFGIPEPLETVMIGWFQGGEVFRSGVTYKRGAGQVFYFQPGHETYPTYHDANIQLILKNAVKWAYSPAERDHRTGTKAAQRRRGRLHMKLLILGTGNMAHTHADAFKAIKGVTLAACADMDLKAAQKFAKSHDIPEAYKSLDEAIEAGGFDAAANVTPDAIH